MVYTKNTKPLTKVQIQKKKEQAEIQSMIDLVKHYIQLKEQEEQREPRAFKFIVNLNDDDAFCPSISLTQLFPSAKLQIPVNQVQKSWADIDEEDDKRFFKTYRPVFH